MDDILERLARLEEREKARDKRDEENALKVAEMHALLMQAKGARWAIIGVAGLTGFLAAKGGAIVQFLLAK